jgi:hypothetical protein
MRDLFTVQDPNDRGLHGLAPKPRMQDEANLGPVMLSSPEQMQEILEREITRLMPHRGDQVDTDLIAEWDAAGHRWRKECGEFPIADYVSHVQPGGFAFAARCRFDADNEGSFAATLKREQANGRWVPTEFAIKTEIQPRNRVTRDAKARLTGAFMGVSGESEADTQDQGKHEEYIAGPVQMMAYVVIWTDAAGRDDFHKAPPVQIKQGTDPQLTQAMLMMAQATAASAEASREATAEVRAATARAELAARAERPRAETFPEATPPTPPAPSPDPLAASPTPESRPPKK